MQTIRTASIVEWWFRAISDSYQLMFAAILCMDLLCRNRIVWANILPSGKVRYPISRKEGKSFVTVTINKKNFDFRGRNLTNFCILATLIMPAILSRMPLCPSSITSRNSLSTGYSWKFLPHFSGEGFGYKNKLHFEADIGFDLNYRIAHSMILFPAF